MVAVNISRQRKAVYVPLFHFFSFYFTVFFISLPAHQSNSVFILFFDAHEWILNNNNNNTENNSAILKEEVE